MDNLTINSQDDKGVLFVADCRDAAIYFDTETGVKHLRINLGENAPVANHVVPALKGKEGIFLVQDLFGKEEDKSWGFGQEQKIRDFDRQKKTYLVEIATDEHPVRWTSGRGLVVLNDYAIMNIRSLTAPTDPGKMSDAGGYGEKADLFDPGHGAHREIAEEILLLSPDRKILVPTFKNGSRGVDFEKIQIKAAKDTGIEFSGIEKILARERKDLAGNSRVIVLLDHLRKYADNLLFLYEPNSNCGIDVITMLECESSYDPKELDLGFAEYFGTPGNFTILGKSNDLALVKIDDLLNEFDRGKDAVPVPAHIRNLYAGKREEASIDATNINGSLRLQLEKMKEQNYKFGDINRSA